MPHHGFRVGNVLDFTGFPAEFFREIPVLNQPVHACSQSIRILTTLTPGQVIEIYRTTTDKLAVKRTEDGTEENIFSLLDEDSDLLELAPGDNLLKATADSGETSLQVTVRFYPMVSGILPEVIS